MKRAKFQLSIEELAYAMGLLGEPGVARGFMITMLGEQDAREMEGHLFAATHSLMARGYLELDFKAGAQHLDKTLAEVVKVLMQHEFSLRCSRMVGEDEYLVNYFFRGEDIVEHTLLHGVVSCLETIRDVQGVVDRCNSFFAPPAATTATTVAEVLGTIPVSVIDQASEAIRQSPKEYIVPWFVEAGMADAVASDLIDDLHGREYRGSILKIVKKDNEMSASDGYLLLKGPSRFWIMEIIPQEPPLVKVSQGARSQLEALLRRLVGQGQKATVSDQH